MKKNHFTMLVLSIIFSLVLSACGGNQAQPPAAEQGAGEIPDSLVVATGGTSGTYYPLGGGMAQIFIDKAGIDASARSTGASVENMRLISAGDVDLAFTQGDIADYASKGTLMFKEGGAVGNLTAIASLYNETVQIIVAKDSPIQSVADLKGKRVSVGAPGSGTEANAQQILEIYGITFESLGKAERLAFGDSTSLIQDGTLDAAFVTAGYPTSAVNELAATKGVRVINLDAESVKKLIEKFPYYAEDNIPSGTYSGLDQEVKTVAVKAQLVARAELDATIVYNITKALFENLEQLKTVHAKGGLINVNKALEGVSLDVHPGAAQYYQEQGVKK